MVASAFFGMSFAAVISLASIVLVDMFGLDSLTASIGLLVLVKGVAMSVGGPVTGKTSSCKILGFFKGKISDFFYGTKKNSGVHTQPDHDRTCYYLQVKSWLFIFNYVQNPALSILFNHRIRQFPGSIYDALQSYDWCFYFAGVSSGAAGLLFLISLLAMRKIKCFS